MSPVTEMPGSWRVVLGVVVLTTAAGCVQGDDSVPTQDAISTGATVPTEDTVTTEVAVLGEGEPYWGEYFEGFGTVEPTSIWFGGVSTGSVRDITWSSWGGSEATGEGTGYYTASGNADAFESRAVVVADDRRECDGVLMYNRIVWWFPDEEETRAEHEPHAISTCGDE